MLIKVRLDYYRRSGKWYSDGEYESSHFYNYLGKTHPFTPAIAREVKQMQESGSLPGLVVGSGKEFIILITPFDKEGEKGVTHLIL